MYRLSPLEQTVAARINAARTNPDLCRAWLRAYRDRFEGSLWRVAADTVMLTQEGAAAVIDAMAFMGRQAPVPPLALSPALSRAAADHVRDIGGKGVLGHGGSDGSGPAQRAGRYGRWQGVIGETIGYGPGDAHLLVLRLIVDDGVPDRGHRLALFDPRYRVLGQACGPHNSNLEQVCVSLLAQGFEAYQPEDLPYL